MLVVHRHQVTIIYNLHIMIFQEDLEILLFCFFFVGMEVANRKREREGEEEGNENFRNGKKLEFLIEDSEVFKFSDSFPSFGVFEFPWEKEENVVSRSDEWESDDIFYPPLVDGSCEFEGQGDDLMCQQLPSAAAIEFPDNGLEESWPLENEEVDGGDCIWSCVLSQPLSIESSKVSCSTLK